MTFCFHNVQNALPISGYGNIFCRTDAGRALTMLFAVFGVPLVLAILNDAGKLLALGANRAWKRICCLIPWRKSNELQKDMLTESVTVQIDSNDESENDDTLLQENSEAIPLTLAIIMCVGWMISVAAFFLLWEQQWNYFESFYFTFISFATIGLGEHTHFITLCISLNKKKTYR